MRAAQSREQILDATIECLLEFGYSGTTTQKVQERAEVSRGRLLYHFPNKRELIMAAVTSATDTRLAQAAARRAAHADAEATGTSEPAARIARLVEGLWSSFAEPIFWVAFEAWTAARTDRELAALTATHERTVLRRVRQSAMADLGPELAAHPRAGDVFGLLFSAMRGQAMTYAFSGRDMSTEPMVPLWEALAAEWLGVASAPTTE
ncbi:TetR/AcrR family transcriptional regulator [Brevibacterium sp. 50QC2O2]|uniref:TetR/AcrR family transcriptional regulator n=1 Tax=Brevibacterium TaxID=1696 RepID=UPI00211C5CAB|nr:MULTISPECIES: TetR/AcrR family transcriptional regulator [unclassified Brevibacterium]MCQ9367513.1 TetR/AcrR family transcriptional regulator [Brevibacterium sp. 91QC2O2]MCQ9385180.1 TetR/AcrR family transcriptional regulator [Brevibacterium sp. 68QC2CO]MCQ9387803.1 TetR/AcrR family transcriptional regulator [Brevibacterium sp. 50QC2O2]